MAGPAAAVDGRHTQQTPIGDLGSPGRAVVDGAGRIAPRVGGWSLAWWIGAEDRWRRPADEPSVRQTLLDGTPVVQTLLHVPGGDVASRAFVARGAAVMEIENLSPLPVAVAFCVEPPVGRVELDGARVTADGVTALLFPRSPSGTAWSVAGPPDVSRLDSGRGSVRDRGDRASAAFVFPLAHRASMRVQIPLAPSPLRQDGSPPPGAGDVARSWAVHRRRGAEIELPPGPMAEALAAATCFLLLANDEGGLVDTALAVEALDRRGFGDEGAALLDMVLEQQRPDGWFGERGAIKDTAAALAAVASHWRLYGGDAALPGTAPSAVALGVGALRRAGRSTDAEALRRALDGLEGAADLLRHWGHSAIARRADAHAADVLAALGGHRAPPAGAIAPEVVVPDAARWEDQTVTARFVTALCQMLVRSCGPSELALCAVLPAAWEGQALGVKRAPTEIGRVSFAVRWHGPRPALLWEVVARERDGELRITAPGLDPAWSSTAATGEALLSRTLR